MIKIQLNIIAISHSVTHSQNYAVVLGENEGSRRLPIVIGGFEAQAIAVAMEQMAPSRPLTHDLFKNALDTFDIELKEVVINNLVDGIFYAKLVCIKDTEEYEIDSRTSDAIALAVRFECPVYTYEFILESAGIELDESNVGSSVAVQRSSEASGSDAGTQKFERMSEEALEKLLNEVLANEDYEKAAKIRDELLRRKSE